MFEQLLAQEPVHQYGSDFQRQSLVRALEGADRLLRSPSARAFDLALEPEASFKAYDTGRFGRGCLLARRLVEAGARYVEVTSEYIPFVNWDSHEHGHSRAEAMKALIDAPIAQLIRDLETRGLLDRTLVVLASEFGRDAVTEGKVGKEVKDQAINIPTVMSDPAPLRDASSLHRGRFRADVRRRRQERASCTARRPTSDPARPSSIRCRSSTCMRRSSTPSASRRTRPTRSNDDPVYVTKDGIGKPIRALFA